MDKAAFTKLTYGLYLLTAKEGDKENGCIINTAVQAASDPLIITLSCNNKNLTPAMILRTGRFNLSALTVNTPFALFQRFGMQSGRKVDKFAGDDATPVSANGIRYLPDAAACFSCKVISSTDLGSHTLFVAQVEDAQVLSDAAPLSYDYYSKNIKPAPTPAPKTAAKAWRCKVCGYIYEGETLPPDYQCPLCHHGVEDFEPV